MLRHRPKEPKTFLIFRTPKQTLAATAFATMDHYSLGIDAPKIPNGKSRVAFFDDKLTSKTDFQQRWRDNTLIVSDHFLGEPMTHGFPTRLEKPVQLLYLGNLSLALKTSTCCCPYVLGFALIYSLDLKIAIMLPLCGRIHCKSRFTIVSKFKRKVVFQSCENIANSTRWRGESSRSFGRTGRNANRLCCTVCDLFPTLDLMFPYGVHYLS